MRAARAGWVSWRVLALTQLREQPLRTWATILAIALGVALGTAVYWINTAAVGEFDRATRRLLGDADLIVRAPASGFDQNLFVTLARSPQVADASPLLELQVILPHSGSTLKLLGLDPFRAQTLQPALMQAIGADITRLFAHDAVVLSRPAAEELRLQQGDLLPIVVGGSVRSLRVIDVMPSGAYSAPLGIMDIASAQWTLERLGRLDRVDLRLRSGVDARSFGTHLAAALPAGVVLVTPQIESARAISATRAYRVNINMLALVALLTGVFLVFSTQSLSVLRRRATLGLLRALGVTRAELQRALLAEGVLIGLAGSLLGLALGAAIAAAVLRYLGADLGYAQLATADSSSMWRVPAMLVFLLIGTAAAAIGAWLPAYEAARRAPALSLRAGDVEPVLRRLPTALPGAALVLLGALLAALPAIGRLPWGGYLSIGALLTGAVLLVPALMYALTSLAPRTGMAVIDTSLAQLKGSAGSSAVSLAAIIVSFSLMVAMSIMVHSFRNSFELWLVKLLPADLELRASAGGDTAALSEAQQRQLAGLPSVARAQFRRVQSIYLRADRAPVALIARDIQPQNAGEVLPLTQTTALALPTGARAAWVSEALLDLYGYRPGEWLELPLAGRRERFFVAGVWRDYTHAGGAIVIARSDYIRATSDRSATEGSIWRRPHSALAATEAAIRAQLSTPAALELISSPDLRERSLMIFDRVFVITYALEAVAVLVGLAGISVAASSAALARRAQFGLLRHLGMLPRQVLAMLAFEGVAQSTLAAVCGLALGSALSVILVYVINRQSFHWSIDLSMPWGELAALALALIGAAGVTALACGRAAMGQDVIRAVREDW